MALFEATCRRWFRWFRDDEFDVRNEEKFEDAYAILDEYNTLSHKQMAEMLNSAYQTISDRLKVSKATCKMLLQKQSFTSNCYWW